MEKGPGAQAGSGKKDVNMPDMVKKNFFLMCLEENLIIFLCCSHLSKESLLR